MDSTPALYCGRMVEKQNFRAFVYGPTNAKRLVNSWDEFQEAMQTGVWFAEPQEPCTDTVCEKPKAKTTKPKKETPKDDDFLPKDA